jgi:ABC-2 type transport system permease protein
VAEFAYSLHLLRRLIGANFRSQMSYRLSLGFEFLGVFFITLLEFASFALVLPRFGDIGGWKLGEVALLAGMVNIAFGTMDLVFSGFDPGNFGRQVRLGRMDQLLLRPVDITLQVLGSEFVLRRLGRIIVGVGIFLLANNLTEIIWTPEKILLLALSIIGQILFFGALFVIGATTTFWTVESIEVLNIFTYGGSEMISYPMHVYPNFLRRFFTFILPAIFLNYFPALDILGRTDPLGFPAIAPWLSMPVGLLIFFIAMRFWRYGLAHYQSTGT